MFYESGGTINRDTDGGSHPGADSRRSGDARHAAVERGASVQFSEEEIDAAVRCARAEFARSFSGCELLKIYYDEAAAQTVIDGYLNHGPGAGTDTAEENVIALFLDFKTGPGASAALNQDFTYYDYGVTLTRKDAGSNWTVEEWGY